MALARYRFLAETANDVHASTGIRGAFNTITSSPDIVCHFLFEESFQNGILYIGALESVIHHLFFCMRGEVIVAVYDSLLDSAKNAHDTSKLAPGCCAPHSLWPNK